MRAARMTVAVGALLAALGIRAAAAPGTPAAASVPAVRPHPRLFLSPEILHRLKAKAIPNGMAFSNTPIAWPVSP